MNFFSKNKAFVKSEEDDNRTLPPIRQPLSFKVGNIQGIGMRENQQDSFGFTNVLDVKKTSQNGLFAVLADGMGGMEGGQLAGRLVTDSLREDFEAMDRQENLAEQLCQMVIKASRKVYDFLQGSGGSTAIACIIYKDELYYAGIGDSSLYLKRDSKLIQIHQHQNAGTLDTIDTIRNGEIVYVGEQTDSSRSGLTEFMGKYDLQVAYFKQPLPLKENDVLLLCTDGITDTLDDKELYVCLNCDDPEKSCQWMEQKVHMHNLQHQDNYTAMVIWCGF